MTATAEPVRRNHYVPDARPSDVYDVVVDFPSYPRLFPEFTSTRVLAVEGLRQRVEFRAKVVIPVRYVLDLVCDPQAHTVDWTFVEGEVVSDSAGGWRFTPEATGVRVDYHVLLAVKAPLPGFMLRKVTDTLVSMSIPAMFSAITREVAARKGRTGP